MYTEYYLCCHRCIYIISCRKWSNLKHAVSCGPGGGRRGNSHRKKKAGQEGWAEALGCPGPGPCTPTSLTRKRWCCCTVTFTPKTPWAGFKHAQAESIISKAAALAGALGCLQHVNPGQALLALCLRGLPGCPQVKHVTSWQTTALFLLQGQGNKSHEETVVTLLLNYILPSATMAELCRYFKTVIQVWYSET